jgi:hypothetical protein
VVGVEQIPRFKRSSWSMGSSQKNVGR